MYALCIHTHIYLYYIYKITHITYIMHCHHTLPTTSLVLFLLWLIHFPFPPIFSSTVISIYFDDKMVSLGLLRGFWGKFIYNSIGCTADANKCLFFPRWLLTDCKPSVGGMGLDGPFLSNCHYLLVGILRGSYLSPMMHL